MDTNEFYAYYHTIDDLFTVISQQNILPLNQENFYCVSIDEEGNMRGFIDFVEISYRGTESYKQAGALKHNQLEASVGYDFSGRIKGFAIYKYALTID